VSELQSDLYGWQRLRLELQSGELVQSLRFLHIQDITISLTSRAAGNRAGSFDKCLGLLPVAVTVNKWSRFIRALFSVPYVVFVQELVHGVAQSQGLVQTGVVCENT